MIMSKGFQILDKEGNAIPINTIDEMVCEYWKVPVKKDSYAMPLTRDKFPKDIKGSMEYHMQQNWYDKIGWLISQDKHVTWKSLKGDIIACQKDLLAESLYNDDIMDLIKILRELYKPWLDLINHFESLGYQPKSVEVH